MSDLLPIRPTLYFDFAKSQKLDPRITFRRASTATFIGSDGLVKTAGTNQPRFEWDFVSNKCLGIVSEQARTNQFTYSQEFDNAAWSKSNCSIVANATTAPDGTLTADRLIETDSNTTHEISRSIPEGIATISVFAKAAENDWLRLYIFSSTYGTNRKAYFNVRDGVLGSVSSGITATIQKLANGWCRISISTPTGSFCTAYIGAAAGNLQDTYPGTSKSLYIWGAQLEYGQFPGESLSFITSYIPTTTSSVTRSADSISVTGANFANSVNQLEGSLIATVKGALNNAYYFTYSQIIGFGSGLNIQTRGMDFLNWSRPGIDYAQSFSWRLDSQQTIKATYTRRLLTLQIEKFATSTATAATNFSESSLIIGGSNGIFSRFIYYPKRLSHTQLTQLAE